MGIAAAFNGELGEAWLDSFTATKGLVKRAAPQNDSRYAPMAESLLARAGNGVTPEEQAWANAELAKWLAKKV
jgi:hypothetical protein